MQLCTIQTQNNYTNSMFCFLNFVQLKSRINLFIAKPCTANNNPSTNFYFSVIIWWQEENKCFIVINCRIKWKYTFKIFSTTRLIFLVIGLPWRQFDWSCFRWGYVLIILDKVYNYLMTTLSSSVQRSFAKFIPWFLFLDMGHQKFHYIKLSL